MSMTHLTPHPLRRPKGQSQPSREDAHSSREVFEAEDEGDEKGSGNKEMAEAMVFNLRSISAFIPYSYS